MATSNRYDRVHDEIPKDPPDPRTSAQRDRDRLLYAPEFRRLAAVTQVVGSQEISLFHNRLTHTLKVAQFARRLAERLGPNELIDADVVETGALAHDIGHPPFGHIAEEELDHLVVNECGLRDGFEGNAQSFRIVTTLASRASGDPGLNFTRASLQAVTKYPWRRAQATGVKHHRKYGCYDADRGDFDWSREGLANADDPTPEAAIMDWADDVTYALHDLDDFVRAGFIPVESIAQDLKEQTAFLSRTRKRWERQARTVTDADWKKHEETADNLFAEFPIGRDRDEAMRQLITAKANLYASGLALSGQKVVEQEDLRRELDLLKALTWTYVIESPALAAQQEGQRRIVAEVFRYMNKAAAHSRHALPKWAQRTLELDDSGDNRARVACDVVASLSEAQIIAVFERVTGNTSGSIHDSISL